MHDVASELKALRLHGMAAAWVELESQDHEALDAVVQVFDHLLQAEGVDRAVRAVRYQMSAARLPTHRDLAGFDFGCSPVDRKLVLQLAECGFAQQAHNVVLVSGPGTGKTHLATAIAVSGITQHGKRVRFSAQGVRLGAHRRHHAAAHRAVPGPAGPEGTGAGQPRDRCAVHPVQPGARMGLHRQGKPLPWRSQEQGSAA